MILNSEEVNSLYHFPLTTNSAPNIAWLSSQQAAAPVSLPTEGLTLGHNNYRGQDQVVKIKPVDRRRHVFPGRRGARRRGARRAGVGRPGWNDG